MFFSYKPIPMVRYKTTVLKDSNWQKQGNAPCILQSAYDTIQHDEAGREITKYIEWRDIPVIEVTEEEYLKDTNKEN